MSELLEKYDEDFKDVEGIPEENITRDIKGEIIRDPFDEPAINGMIEITMLRREIIPILNKLIDKINSLEEKIKVLENPKVVTP